MRKLIALSAAVSLLGPASLAAAPIDSARGLYVEARSAQVFIGGCIMSSEAHTVGREAILTWHVETGSSAGVPLDGLTLVAVVAGERNLGLDLEAPRETVLFVDDSASAAQQQALTELFTARFGSLFGRVVDVVGAPIAFAEEAGGYTIRVGTDVRVAAEPLPPRHHDLTSCGQMEWYEPFVPLDQVVTAVAREHAYSGDRLPIRWSDPHGQSAYYGAFSF